MCGIAGVVAWDDRFRVGRETVVGMSGRIAHRGPDDGAIWCNHEQEATGGRPQCWLAFRRLAILDLDRRASQPMTDGRRWLVFNGEIYNFREIRGELDRIAGGYAWKTWGDSEVILRAYEQWGGNCVEHFNGMFAFAIFDPEAGSLFLGRDRMGQKPMYYAVAPAGGAVAFGSELGAVMEVGWVDGTIDSGNVIEYLRRGYVPRGSIYENVDSLAPGATVAFPAPGVQRKYFDPNLRAGEMGGSARELLNRAVGRQLVSDVPVGCFLSGGIDSSIIAAAMKRAAGGDQKVLTFSIGFDDPRYDETGYAAAVAKHLGTEHREFVVRADAANDLPKLAAVFGEPFGDSSALPTHYLARETREYVKVALSGDGGDELFGGYERYRAAGLAARIDRHPALGAILGNRVWRRLPGVHPKSRGARGKRFAASLGLSPGARYAGYVEIFDEGMIGKLLGEELAGRQELGSGLAEEYEKLLVSRDAAGAGMALDRVSYLPGDILTKVDRASMLHGLEVRSPFMDHEVVGFAAGLSGEEVMRSGPKGMLREGFAGELPGFVFKRKKMGFAVPIGEWLRGGLREMMRDLIFARDSFVSRHLNVGYARGLVEEHEEGRGDHSQRLYALVMLELWAKLRKGG